ncbi:hypothetical protein, partial [Mesorhizobium intechi]|uniref:hypothetical protein n=1 Tax=Mesorhizobium intechi TaxID=537601 RepID=UPI001ABFF800
RESPPLRAHDQVIMGALGLGEGMVLAAQGKEGRCKKQCEPKPENQMAWRLRRTRQNPSQGGQE